MKKRNVIFFLLLLALVAEPISAQFHAGIIGGLNFADMKAENEINSRTFWGAGGIIQYSFNDNFSIVTEPMYIQKGGISIEENDNPEIKIKLGFIQLPIYLKYSFLLNENIKPYLIAGQSIGYRTSSELEADIYGVTFKADLEHLTKTFDWQVALGTGIEIPLNNFSVFFEGTYSWGLNNLNKKGTFIATGGDVSIDGELDDDSNFKTRGLQLVMGVTFQL